MNVSTNLTAGSVKDSALQAASVLGNQVSSFINTAELQATDITSTIANTASNVWQGLTGWIGL